MWNKFHVANFFFLLSPFLLLPVVEFYHRKDVDRSLIYITSKSSKFFILFLSTQHFFRHSWMFIKYWGEEFKFHGMDCASNVVWYDADAFLCKFQQQFFLLNSFSMRSFIYFILFVLLLDCWMWKLKHKFLLLMVFYFIAWIMFWLNVLDSNTLWISLFF